MLAHSFSTSIGTSTRLCTSRRDHHANRISNSNLEESKESFRQSYGWQRDLHYWATHRQQGVSYINQWTQSFLGNAWQWSRLDDTIRQGGRGLPPLKESHPRRELIILAWFRWCGTEDQGGAWSFLLFFTSYYFMAGAVAMYCRLQGYPSPHLIVPIGYCQTTSKPGGLWQF